MMPWLVIALGGALGAVGRYWVVGRVTAWLGSGFPYGTLLVNLSGSLLMGMAFVAIVEQQGLHPQARSLLMVGFLGAFTTFSTFSLETVSLLQQQQYLPAMTYIMASVILCVLAAALGIWLARLVI